MIIIMMLLLSLLLFIAIIDDIRNIGGGLPYKIPVFSDPAPGKSYATTYEQMGS